MVGSGSLLFPTPEYAAFFLVAFLGAWALVPRPLAHKAFLLLASWAFYAWWDWRFVPLLAGVSIFATLVAEALQRITDARARRALLALAVAVLLSTLVGFKYLTFAFSLVAEALERAGLQANLQAPEAPLPVGLSFFVFHAISLVVDAHRRAIPVRVRLLDGLLYVAFFPQLIAGPILRAAGFLVQLDRGPERSIDASAAALLFIKGLVKKVVLANFLATQVVDPVYVSPESATALDALFAFYGYAAQIYCDFSGYTDMATASALLLGYRFPQNFDAPYRARSLSDFWRRWHISLSSWLRDYLFIPLGGSRGSSSRTAFNITVTMLLGGLWHGAGVTFLAWGALHAIGLVAERWLTSRAWPALVRLRRSPLAPALATVVVFHFVCIGWVLFRAPSFEAALGIFAALGRWGPPAHALALAVIVLALAAQWAPARVETGLRRGWARLPLVAQGLALATAVMLIEVWGPSGVLPFIYFQF
ncbi:MAG: MBOAT family protein [Archangiaceae bacterium]|nr:MBOAT family protein [Archangiaceae bacterium]